MAVIPMMLGQKRKMFSLGVESGASGASWWAEPLPLVRIRELSSSDDEDCASRAFALRLVWRGMMEGGYREAGVRWPGGTECRYGAQLRASKGSMGDDVG
jgi:hypothetical protein